VTKRYPSGWWDDGLDPANEEFLYHPPWYNADTGEWYGPKTDAVYADQCRKYEHSSAGGGLWDEIEAPPEKVWRHVGITIGHLVAAAESMSTPITGQQRAIALARWRDRRRLKGVAEEHGLTMREVSAEIQRAYDVIVRG
jgi:hypothetical protein